MNEQHIIQTLMQNPNFKNALREMLLHDKTLAAEMGFHRAEDTVYVWCAEMLDCNTGNKYYHPIVVPKCGVMSMPDVEYMLAVDNYAMMASKNQFEAHGHEPMMRMFRSVYSSVNVRLIAVPESTYNKLEEALTVLVTSILDEVVRCFDHLENIARMANTDVGMLKIQLLMSVFGNMTTVAACFDQEMEIHDSANHDYHVYDEDDDLDDDYDDWDEEDDA